MRWQRTHLTRVVDASCDALHVRRIDDAVRVDPEHIAAAVSRNAAHRLPSLALVACDDLAREPAYQLARLDRPYPHVLTVLVRTCGAVRLIQQAREQRRQHGAQG